MVQFVEVFENSKPDHVHVNSWTATAPESRYAKMDAEMPLGRHGGQRHKGSGVLNYSFNDGHCELVPAEAVYQSEYVNRFDPSPPMMP